MDRWKAEMERVREKRKIRREKSRRERVRRKKMQMREKVGKSRFTVFFQWFVAPEGRKVGSLKRRVRSQLARGEMKNCTPLWREAHFQVKRYKAPGSRSTFGSWDVEKVHAVVARSTFPSQNVQSTPWSDHFWKLRCRKSARGAKHIGSQNVQNTSASEHFWKLRCRKSARRCGAKHISKSKVQKNWRVRSTSGRSDVLSRGRRKGLCNLAKVSKTWGFCGISKNAGRRGTFEEDLQRCISRGRRSTKDMFIRDVRRSGRWFPERGCILEHQIFRFAEMILRDRCGTSYDLASIFRGRRSTLHRWSGKIAKRIGKRLPALHSTFHLWRKSRRIALFLTLLSSIIEEVRRIAAVLDVVRLKNKRSVTELVCFWCC